MTIDYRRLARAFGGGSGRPNPLKLIAGTALPPNAEPPAVPRDAKDDYDAAPAMPAQTHVLARSPPATAIALVSPVDALLAALDAAADDVQRAALLAAASVDVREGLFGALAYRALVAPLPNVALDTLVAALDSAADDAQRAALLTAASRELRAALADHLWWCRVPVSDGQQRYLDMIK
jgi:hypothetical protein